MEQGWRQLIELSPGFRIIGSQTQRIQQMLSGGINLALAEAQLGHIEVGFGAAGLQGQGACVGLFSFCPAACFQEDVAEVVEGLGVVGV